MVIDNPNPSNKLAKVSDAPPMKAPVEEEKK